MSADRPPIVAYADADAMVATEVTTSTPAADVRRIHVPQPRQVASLPRGLLLCVISAAIYMVTAASHVVLEPRDRLTAMVELAFCMSVLGALSLFSYNRLNRRLSVEVTPFALTVTTAGPLGVERQRWTRSQVIKLHLNRIDQKLYVKLSSDHEVAILVSSDPATAAAAFDALTAAIGETPAAPLGQQLQPPDSSGAMPPSPTRDVVLRVGYGLAIVALVCLPFAWPLSLVLLVAASVPFGIAMGTQRKDVWT